MTAGLEGHGSTALHKRPPPVLSETELPRQTGPEPEPDGASPSRTEREPTVTRPGPCSTDPDRSRAPEGRSRTGRLRVGRNGSRLHTADRGRSRTHNRAVKLGSGWAGALRPAVIPVSVPVRHARTGPTAPMQHGRPIGFFLTSRSGISMDSMRVETMHVWNTPGKGLFLRGMCGY